MSEIIRIATRESPLALWQANAVRDQLLALDPETPVELRPMKTKGDIWLKTSLAKLGGKGLFVKELERALMDNDADLAVHSMKDVTAVMPEGLVISTVLAREDPFDALVSNKYKSLNALPKDAVIGTCSPRRLSQIKHYNPGFQIKDLRGNVNTRLKKLDDGNFDAIILACAGLKRLGFERRIAETLAVETSLPAVGQGIIGIEVRSDDTALQTRLAKLHDDPAAVRLRAERAVSATLNGGCSAPVAAYSVLDEQTLTLDARVISLDGKTLLKTNETITLDAALGDEDSLLQAHELGVRAARTLFDQGAQAILDSAELAHASD